MLWSRCFRKWQRAVSLHYGHALTLSMSLYLHNVLPLVSPCVFVTGVYDVDDI